VSNQPTVPSIRPTGPSVAKSYPCGFDHDGWCYAANCSSQRPCTTRESNGVPRKIDSPEGQVFWEKRRKERQEAPTDDWQVAD
jgi:hypothetical protein